MVYNAEALFTSGSYMIPRDNRSERTTRKKGSEYELQCPCDCILI